ncbi:MAG: SDR family oxidoreductase [Candidatus Eremiobacteraeota bacterium]|nr:SDR family oxidoreductase [Candidatus Eremiobacteraeota bacterium]
MLEQKVAIVTGGSSGIGRATALAFVREGARVVLADIDEPGGRETLARIEELGGEAEFVRCDVSVYAEVEAVVDRAVARFGSLDAMFNNAGIGAFAPLLDHTPEQFDLVVKINQYGVFYGILAAAKKMRDLGVAGTIVNTASVLGVLASKGAFGYHATKAAVRMMSQTAALELAPYGIRCVAIAPGSVDTPIIDGYREMGLGRVLARGQMRGRILTPEAIAEVVVWLCSAGADAVNGSTIFTDDGFASFK